MTRALASLGRRLRRMWRREDGTASIEFVMFVPVVVTIFMASIESGFYMIKHVMLERGVDMVMRDYRLGNMGLPEYEDLRDQICDATPIIHNCRSELKLWVSPVNTATWEMPIDPAEVAYCGDNNGNKEEESEGGLTHGGSNQIMFIRVCTLAEPIFPTTGIGLKLRADSLHGGYQLATATVFVNEPR